MSIKNKYKVLSVTHRECKEWFLKKHYAKRIPMSSYLFGLYTDYKDSLMPSLELNGVISFGGCSNPHMDRIFNPFRVLELNRLVVNENLEKNTLSFFVSKSIQQLPIPVILISYADHSVGHNGFIYQATNWIYTGLNEGHDTKWFEGEKEVHSRTLNGFGLTDAKLKLEAGYTQGEKVSKHRYFYFLGTKKDIKKMKALLPYKQQPYPKGNNSRYNADFKPKIQLRYDL